MKEQILENPTLVCTEQEQVPGDTGLQGHLEKPREIQGNLEIQGYLKKQEYSEIHEYTYMILQDKRG